MSGCVGVQVVQVVWCCGAVVLWCCGAVLRAQMGEGPLAGGAAAAGQQGANPGQRSLPLPLPPQYDAPRAATHVDHVLARVVPALELQLVVLKDRQQLHRVDAQRLEVRDLRGGTGSGRAGLNRARQAAAAALRPRAAAAPCPCIPQQRPRPSTPPSRPPAAPPGPQQQPPTPHSHTTQPHHNPPPQHAHLLDDAAVAAAHVGRHPRGGVGGEAAHAHLVDDQVVEGQAGRLVRGAPVKGRRLEVEGAPELAAVLRAAGGGAGAEARAASCQRRPRPRRAGGQVSTPKGRQSRRESAGRRARARRRTIFLNFSCASLTANLRLPATSGAYGSSRMRLGYHLGRGAGGWCGVGGGLMAQGGGGGDGGRGGTPSGRGAGPGRPSSGPCSPAAMGPAAAGPARPAPAAAAHLLPVSQPPSPATL